MSRRSRPWWASDPAEPDDVDPLEAHLWARHGAQGVGAAPDRGGGAPPGDGEANPGPADDPQGSAAQVCAVCPICRLARGTGDLDPAVMAHLMRAARHLAAAARAFALTAAAGDRDPGPGAEPADAGREADDVDEEGR